MADDSKPLLVFDGDCDFCRVWVGRWRAVTGDAVEYAAYQEIGPRFPQIAEADFASSVHLIDSDGSVYRGAEAVFRSLALARRGGAALWLYRRVPLAARCAELSYRLVASNRGVASFLTRALGLDARRRPEHQFVRALLSRGVGLVYFLAFVSLWSQIDGLIGSRGVSPVEPYLAALADRFDTQVYLRFPTVLWWGATDRSIHLLCGVGTAASVMLTVGVLPRLAALGCWVAYLSLLTAGQVFLSFQWDILLLESGLLTILLAPSGVFPRPSLCAPVSRPVVWAFRWLVFRLMLASGLVKLFSGDPAWRDLTALAYHYESQPLPPWTAWYAHQLPEWFHLVSTGAMFAMELLVPFFIFAPRKLRHIAVLPLVGLQIIIAATGNYCFFNLLTVVLCLSLLDDDAIVRLIPDRLTRASIDDAEGQADRRTASMIATALTTSLVGCILVLSAASFAGQVLGYARVPAPLRRALEAVRPLRVTSTYGLFAVMTKGRPEIILEGSNDGKTWKPYEFRWKPGDPDRAPRFVAPHQPRLDWQMWFAALGSYRRNPWLSRLMARLLEGSPPVLALLADNPFPDSPPLYVRAQLYQYSFTRRGHGGREGAGWWTRTLKGPYHPVMTRRR